MSLSFVGPGGCTEQRWVFYALLRDNILHHLERTRPPSGFSAIYLAGAALGADEVRVSARALRAEMERARALLARSIDELAISGRTRAALMLLWPSEAPTETCLVSLTPFPSLPVPAGTTCLGDIFGNLIEELLRVTEGAGENDMVEIRDC